MDVGNEKLLGDKSNAKNSKANLKIEIN